MIGAAKDRARNTPANGPARVAKPTLPTACLLRPTIRIVRYIARTAICQKSRTDGK